jgi:hypothetical protein
VRVVEHPEPCEIEGGRGGVRVTSSPRLLYAKFKNLNVLFCAMDWPRTIADSPLQRIVRDGTREEKGGGEEGNFTE